MTDIEIDPYGHEKLAERTDQLPIGSEYVASANVAYELISSIEKYWIQHVPGPDATYSLWCCNDLGFPEFYCCARLPARSDLNIEGAAELLISTLWGVRHPVGCVLNDFRKEGMIEYSRLKEIEFRYHERIKPKKSPVNAPIENGKMFYENNSIKYDGELKGGFPYGRGTGYWANGTIWCDGSFKDGKPHGQCSLYFKSGQLRHVGTYVDGYPKGPGKEFYENGQLWFEGTFGQQSFKYNYGARIWIEGSCFDRDGNLKHSGRFNNSGSHSRPIRNEDEIKNLSNIEEEANEL